MRAKLLQLCVTLCDPMACGPPGSSVLEFLQTRIWSGCYALLQGIFPTQGSLSLLTLLHLQGDSLPLATTWEAHRMHWNSTNFTAHTKIQLFSCLQSPWNAASHWLISRALKKLIIATFCQHSHCFYGGENFSGPSPFCWHLQCIYVYTMNDMVGRL